MRKQRRRRRSLAKIALAAVVAGVVAFFASAAGRPAQMNGFWAAATFHADGSATVHETIDYHFAKSRHGIYRTIPGLSMAQADQIEVTGGEAQVQPIAEGIRIRIGNPNEKVSGDHRYGITYPLPRTQVSPGRIGWNAVGTQVTVPIAHAELDLVAPWKWTAPECSVGARESFQDCAISQPEPGHLVVSHGHLDPGEGITVYARRGTPLAATPSPRTPHSFDTSLPFFQQPVTLAVGAFLLVLVAAGATARLLRRAGRDWVMAGAASTDNAADAAFAPLSGEGVPAGAIRVDDTRLAEWTTTAFAPPRGITAAQGGVLAAEEALPRHRTAWLLGAAIDGHLDLDDSNPDAMVISRKDHAPDDTTAMLEVAFAGRDSVNLGAYDPHFASLWSSLTSHQEQWLLNSGYMGAGSQRRVLGARMWGGLAAVLGAIALVAGAFSSFTHSVAGPVGVLVGAVVAGMGVALFVRAWELHVRTPAGSAMWLRVASFRHFLHNSEAHHVEEAARRGVLREYTAWAVALDEVDHWRDVVQQAQLPPDTIGLQSALMIGMFSTMFMTAGTAPSTSGGGGGGGFGGFGGGLGGFGGGIGVGGGFGGGGVGGW